MKIQKQTEAPYLFEVIGNDGVCHGCFNTEAEGNAQAEKIKGPTTGTPERKAKS
jgi:hypothetical protein